MGSDIIDVVVALAFLVAIIVLNYRVRRSKAVYVCDYQVGLKFENGERCRVLGPGNHYSIAATDPITVVDMRPYQFVIEQQPFKDRLQIASLISVGGELSVCDPQLAVRTLKKILDESVAIIRENLRQAASRCIADTTAHGRQRLAAEIKADLNNELQRRGMEIRNLAITELWSHADSTAVPATAH